MSDRPVLALHHISRSFGSVPVLQDISLEVAPGEVVVIVGPSGCGKTTLLNILSGHDAPSSGEVSQSGILRRVYQSDGLFPWLTVTENIKLGLRDIPAADREREFAELIALIRLEGFESYYPHQLSGGMRQRVELARALAGEADALLMDEPFSALDYQTRLRLRRELAHLLLRKPRATVLVTHDLEEAAQLADRILVLSARPAHIQCELRPELPRPRDLTHPVVVDTIRQLLDILGLEAGD